MSIQQKWTEYETGYTYGKKRFAFSAYYTWENKKKERETWVWEI